LGGGTVGQQGKQQRQDGLGLHVEEGELKHAKTKTGSKNVHEVNNSTSQRA
jgi:hypothetical protein